MKNKVYYIDPQSYNNLSMYDYSLLQGINDFELYYYHNEQYDCPLMNHIFHRNVFVYSSKRGKLSKTISYCKSMASIFKDVIKEHPDIVHIQWLRLWILDFLFAVFLRAFGVKLVFTAHNTLPHDPHIGDNFLYKLYYRVTSAIIVHTQRTKLEISSEFGICPEKIHVIPHGMLESDVCNDVVLKRCEELKKQLNINSNDIVFSCLGYQYEYKGIGLVADAWACDKMLFDNTNVHLLVVGKNRNVNPMVFNKVKDFANVFVFDGQLSSVDFDAYLMLSSVILLPYISISQSGLMFSALSNNIPILVSDVGGLTDPLYYANVGWNLGEPTTENVRKYLLYLISHKEEIDNIHQDVQAFDKIKEVYSWNKISTATSQLYMRLLGKNI